MLRACGLNLLSLFVSPVILCIKAALKVFVHVEEKKEIAVSEFSETVSCYLGRKRYGNADF